MRILIIGDGKVGYALAEQLSMEDHDVTIVDNNAEALRKAVEKLDVLCIQGSGSSKTTLLEADIEKKDLIIVVTSSDELNMVCSLLAHKLSKARIITRIRNPEYAESEDFIKDVLGIDLCINPELSAANEISRLLRYPHAFSIESFAGGKLEIIEIAIHAGSLVLDKPLSELIPKLPAHILIGAIKRDDEILIPNGSTVLQAEDHIFIVGVPQQIYNLAKYLGQFQQKTKNVMIIGGSRIAYYLASNIQRLGIRTRIIESDQKRCDELFQLLPDSIIINGDGTDHELLDQERLSEMDAFVALTDRDEENIIAGMYAKDCNVNRVVVKVTRQYYSRIASDLSIISPKELTANRIVLYVRSIVNSQGSFVERLHRIAQGKAEAMEFSVGPNSRLTNIPLKKLKLKNGIIVVAIMHKGHITIPFGEDMIREGDNVIIITNGNERFLDLNDILLEG